MQASYGDFAYVYDALTNDVEYEKRTAFVEGLFLKHLENKPELICDLGCGTGTVCTILEKKGYDCIGIDSSESMLSVAQKKNCDNKVLYLNQDITDFELYGTVDVFLCMLDTLNYITEPKDIEKVFKLVHNYLNPAGLFIFDVNTLYKFETVLSANTFVYEADDIFYTWENYFEDSLLDFELNFFVKENEKNNYKRFSEHHTQRYYSQDFICDMAKKYNFEVKSICGDLDDRSPNVNDERMYIVLKKI